MGIHKDYKDLSKRLHAIGWKVEPTTQGHYRIFGDLQVVHAAIGRSIKDKRTYQNILSELRRAGLDEAEAKHAAKLAKEQAKVQTALDAETEALLEEEQPMSTPKSSPVQPKIDTHMLAIMKFGAALGAFDVEPAHLKKFVGLLRQADGCGLNLMEAIEAIETIGGPNGI